MVTAELFHPASFGAGAIVASMVGGVRSTVSDGEIGVDPPAFVPTMFSVCAPSGPTLKLARVQVPFATVAAVPLTVTDVAVPAPPESVTTLVLMNDPGRGSVSESVGGGMVTTETCALALLFAASAATAGVGTRLAGPAGSEV